MARNEEKSQSMLFRFRETQAASLGLSVRTDRRPRVASSCKDLRQCERWRGEILREISRKVAKIQDAGLTDYEVRDLNDEINKLLREKHHWENQIIFLGGANYKRAGKMTDSEGREVPGMRGYKYFGRAKDLPGVKELFDASAAEQAEVDSFKKQRHTIFDNVGPGYYGDEDEKDGELLEYEAKAEAEAWEEALENLAEMDIQWKQPPPAPKAAFVSLDDSASANTAAEDVPAVDGKRKAASGGSKASKKAKLDAEAEAATKAKEQQEKQLQSGAGFMSVLKAEDLRPPKLLTADEMDRLIVQKQKEELRKQFLDDDDGPEHGS